MPITTPYKFPRLRLQCLEKIQTLPYALNNLICIFPTSQLVIELRSQRLLHNGSGERHTDDRTQRSKEVRAGGGDGLVLWCGAGDQTDQGCGYPDPPSYTGNLLDSVLHLQWDK